LQGNDLYTRLFIYICKRVLNEGGQFLLTEPASMVVFSDKAMRLCVEWWNEKHDSASTLDSFRRGMLDIWTKV